MTSEINYGDIIRLGFKEYSSNDPVYFNQYGYEYKWYTLYLTKRVYLHWSKEDRICTMRRENEEGEIRRKARVLGLKQLELLIDFFRGK